MKHVKTYESYNEELIVEKLNLKPLIDKFKTSINKKTVAKLIVGILLSTLTVHQTINYINKNFKEDEEDMEILVELVSKFVDPISLTISDSAISYIKEHEKLRLKAYKLGDGKITVGYGHAESIGKSAFRLGQVISEETADTLLRNDLKVAEDGIKRMFKQWKEEGVDMKITQGQYDALVSMAFNMGVTGLRNTEFIDHFKNGNLDYAAELIKTTKINDKKFPGLRKRRLTEYNMFIS
jgi:GH24 family phage-related lysozyme (muramidase)